MSNVATNVLAPPEPVVTDIGPAAAAEDLSLQQIESLCMRCERNGITRLLLTRIPHFRELVLMAFECSHCGERNNEVQFAGQLAPRACIFTLKVPAGDTGVLNRQVVKADSATIRVPEIELEIPPEAQRGTLSTVEGVLMRVAQELEALQPERREADPTTAAAIDEFLVKLKACGTGTREFTFVVDDPAGNSFVENPHAPAQDPLLSCSFYERTPEQQAALGYVVESQDDEGSGAILSASGSGSVGEKRHTAGHGLPHGSIGAQAARHAIAQGNSEDVAAALFKYSAPEEIMVFPATCGACAAACETRMFVTNIPYFKEVIVMASTCDICGYRNSELKAGGSVPLKGKRITANILSKTDLNRDVIKSDTASVLIPELDLELAPGTLGGLVTTVEGLLSTISENLQRLNTFGLGDSAESSMKQRWVQFHQGLNELKNLDKTWTLILDDALANSFIAPATDGLEGDKQLVVEEFERTWEQNEELGLNDMDTTSADVAYETQAVTSNQ